MEEFQHYCLFGEPWWLNAVTGEAGWDEARVESGGEIHARLPYTFSRRFGLRSIGMPPLTQTLGPYYAPFNGKYANKLAREKDLAQQLIDKLPAHDLFSQNFHHVVTNWLPWYWYGFQQTTRYTYELTQLHDEEALWNELLPNMRGNIRKAKKRFGLSIRDEVDPDSLLRVCDMTFQRQGLPGLPEKLVRRIVDACERRGSGRCLFAVDKRERIHASMFLVWDARTTYNLLAGGDPELRSSGAHSMLMWEAIRHAAGVSAGFDFEGSMIESVERFFRAFGGRQTPYFSVGRLTGRLRFVPLVQQTLLQVRRRVRSGQWR